MKNLKNPSKNDVSRRTATSKNKPTYNDYIKTRLHTDKMLYYNKSAAHEFALTNKELAVYTDIYLVRQPKEEDLHVFDVIVNAACLNELVEVDELPKQQIDSPYWHVVHDYVVPNIYTCMWITKKHELSSNGDRDLAEYLRDKLFKYILRAMLEAEKSEAWRYSYETDD